MKFFEYDKLLLLMFLLSMGCQDPVHDSSLNPAGEFRWEYARPEEVGMHPEKINALKKDLLQKGTKKFLIIKNDKIVCEGFADGWHDSVRSHYTASLAKALVGGMSLIAAINDSLIHPDAPAFHYIPSWSDSYPKSKITIRHLATHTSGLEDAEATPEEKAVLIKRNLDRHMDLPGWKGQFWRQDPDPFSVSRDSAKVIFRPGSQYQYSNPGIAMLTYAVTASLKGSSYSDIRSYLKDKIFQPIGVRDKEYALGYNKTFSVDSLDLVGSWGGANFTAHGAARVGRLMLRKGNWEGLQLLDEGIVERAITYAGTALPSSRVISRPTPDESVRLSRNPVPASTLGWYSNHDGIWPFLPRDAFCGAGAGNQILLVIPGLDLIVVRMGNALFDESKGENFWGSLEEHLFNPLMDAVSGSPYPVSDVISSVEFAPPSDVIRMAEGGDNWPMTWGDDDALYTAYGDGWGFDPKTKEKLSLGLAKVMGSPPGLRGENIRTQTGERVGEGAFGPKASGMLMVDGTLYMWVRNMKNSQLASSEDHGKTWTWANWKFEESFGCPTFLNYGKNYIDARDEYVYTYSADDASAYKFADQMVMARVPKDKVMDWKHYEFFAGYDDQGSPQWTEDIRKRKPTFVNPGKCYRTGITYSQVLKRYLWCHIIPLSAREEAQGPRFNGGLGIFESADPWGPWKTVYYTRQWDMGPGESGSLPPKWMSEDGNSLYYLFSGDDSFSVRKLTIKRNK